MKEGEFIKIEYTGKTEDGFIFDTTSEKVAKEAGIHRPNMKYGPAIIKLGEQQLLPGLEKAVMGASIGKHTIKLGPESAFGKKSAKLLRLVPSSVLKKNNIRPYVGQELDLDGQRGVVRVASPGRTIVDFNHPLAGLTVEYDFEIIEKVTDEVQITEGMMQLLNLKYTKVEKNDNGVTVIMPDLGPEQLQEFLKKELNRLTGLKIELKKQ